MKRKETPPRLVPCGTRVFIRPEVEERNGRFFLPRMSRQMPQTGVVLAMAPKARVMVPVEPGDRVVFDRHHQQLSDDWQTTVIEAQHLLAILE